MQYGSPHELSARDHETESTLGYLSPLENFRRTLSFAMSAPQPQGTQGKPSA